MEAAGIDTEAFKPRSTWAAATSKAKEAYVPIHDISDFASSILQID